MESGSDQRLQATDEALGQSGTGAPGVVDHLTNQSALRVLTDEELQIKPGGPRGNGKSLHLKTIHVAQRRHRHRGELEQHLNEGSSADVAIDLQRLDDLLEGKFLMSIGLD